jgi:flagellar hook-associated protein 1 FlgK
MGSFDGLYIGLSALRAQQTVLSVISNNTANVDTTGYSDETATLAALPSAADGGVAAVGAGVDVEAVRRSTSAILNQQIAQEASVDGQWDTMQSGSDQIQQLFNATTSSGILDDLDNFWSSWQTLSDDPTNTASRTSVVQAGDELTADFNQTATSLNDNVATLNDQLSTEVQSLNQYAGQISAINQQVMNAEASGNPANQLLDERDTLVQEISQIAQVQTAQNADGSLTVSLGGHLLVSGTGASQINVGQDVSGNPQPVWADDNTTVNVSSGQLAATQNLRDWVQGTVLPQLNQVASEVITQVNTLQESGYDANGDQGGAFFTGTDASTIATSSTVEANPETVATSSSADEPGDGSVALAIAELQEQTLNDPTNGFVDESIDGAYTTLVGNVGLMAQKSSTMATQQDQLMSYLNDQQQEVAGVSLDEQSTQMLATQEAYEAASRVITTVNDMLDVLINGTGADSSS